MEVEKVITLEGSIKRIEELENEKRRVTRRTGIL